MIIKHTTTASTYASPHHHRHHPAATRRQLKLGEGLFGALSGSRRNLDDIEAHSFAEWPALTHSDDVAWLGVSVCGGGGVVLWVVEKKKDAGVDKKTG